MYIRLFARVLTSQVRYNVTFESYLMRTRKIGAKTGTVSYFRFERFQTIYINRLLLYRDTKFCSIYSTMNFILHIENPLS